MNLFSVSNTITLIVCLNDCSVFAEKLEIDFVLWFITFEGGKVEVEVETTCVSFRDLDFGGEGSVEETDCSVIVFLSFFLNEKSQIIEKLDGFTVFVSLQPKPFVN